MGVFRQLGDPVCPPCLCQHHGAAYNELLPTDPDSLRTPNYITILNNTTIVQQTIVLTERCCIAVNAASAVHQTVPHTDFEIERPFGSIRTTQESSILSGDIRLHHHATWETHDPGTYTYYLVNRAGVSRNLFAAWIKIIASDCEA